MDWLKNIITVYLAEASFCKDAERALRARLDFKDLGKEDE